MRSQLIAISIACVLPALVGCDEGTPEGRVGELVDRRSARLMGYGRFREQATA